MLCTGFLALVTLLVNITRLSLRVNRCRTVILIKNARSILSLIVLFGIVHLVVFLHFEKEWWGTFKNILISTQGMFQLLFQLSRVKNSGIFMTLFWGILTSEFRSFFKDKIRRRSVRNSIVSDSLNKFLQRLEISEYNKPHENFFRDHSELSVWGSPTEQEDKSAAWKLNFWKKFKINILTESYFWCLPLMRFWKYSHGEKKKI